METITREPIKLARVALEDFVKNYEGKHPEGLKLINIRGCNGSGKSTVPLQLLAKDRGAFIFTLNGKDKATCFPSYGYVAAGRYKTATGGLDGMKNNAETAEVIEALWLTPFNIIMEGIMCSTILSTYAAMFKEYQQREDHKRDIGVMNLVPPLEVALARVQVRNGGKEVDEKAIGGKWRTVDRNADKFLAEGITSWRSDNSDLSIEDTLDWYFDEVNKNMGVEE